MELWSVFVKKVWRFYFMGPASCHYREFDQNHPTVNCNWTEYQCSDIYYYKFLWFSSVGIELICVIFQSLPFLTSSFDPMVIVQKKWYHNANFTYLSQTTIHQDESSFNFQVTWNDVSSHQCLIFFESGFYTFHCSVKMQKMVNDLTLYCCEILECDFIWPYLTIWYCSSSWFISIPS